jgi:molybdopterin synthase sulfur carrier subunit
MTAIRIPPVLRTATGAPASRSKDRPSAKVIDRLVATYPGTATQLQTPNGELNAFVNVFVNGTDVRHLQALDTPVGSTDQVILLPAMAGG